MEEADVAEMIRAPVANHLLRLVPCSRHSRRPLGGDNHQIPRFLNQKKYWRTAIDGDAGNIPRPTFNSQRPGKSVPCRRPALPAVGARREGNLAKLKRIKVNQGDVFKNVEDQDEKVRGGCGDEPSPPRDHRLCRGPSRTGRCSALPPSPRLRRGRPKENEARRPRPAHPVVGARREGNLAKLKRIKVNQGDVLLRTSISRTIRPFAVDFSGATGDEDEAPALPRWRVSHHHHTHRSHIVFTFLFAEV